MYRMNWKIGESNMKFLVIGCNGMAGHIISLYLKEQGHFVNGFARKKSPFIDTIVGDATDFDLLRDTILNNKYDSVINCVGILNQFAEEAHANAVILNSYLPHYLAKITENTNIQIIQMSTDCVFSGRRGGYTENDLRDGETFYDRSKALGELEDSKNITLRNSIVGPDINEKGIGLLNWFMKQSGTIYGYTNAMWTGLTTLQLAKIMESAAEQKAHGLFNMVYKESISKNDLLKLFNKYLRNDKITILPNDDFVVDKSLKRTNYEFNYDVPDYETMVAELAQWMKAHRDLYPHYDIAD